MNSTFTSTNGVVHPTASASEHVHFAHLADLPDGLSFPAESQERIWYESDKRRLAFRGFMSKAAFDRLQALHPDPNYHHALEALFQAGSLRGASRQRAALPRSWPVVAAVVAIVSVIGLVLLLTF